MIPDDVFDGKVSRRMRDDLVNGVDGTGVSFHGDM